MRVIEAVVARLGQSVEMAANFGMELPASDPSYENQFRSAIWRCIFCRRGSECAEWTKARKPGVPGFCANREFHLGLPCDAA